MYRTSRSTFAVIAFLVALAPSAHAQAVEDSRIQVYAPTQVPPLTTQPMADSDPGLTYVRNIEDEAAASIDEWLSEPEVMGEREVVATTPLPRELSEDHPFLFLLMLAGVVWAILTFVE